MQGRGAAPSATTIQDGNHRGASLCFGLVLKRVKASLLAWGQQKWDPAPGWNKAQVRRIHTGDTHRDTTEPPTKILGATLQLLQVHHLLANHAAVVVICGDMAMDITGVATNLSPELSLAEGGVGPLSS